MAMEAVISRPIVFTLRLHLLAGFRTFESLEEVRSLACHLI
jgi:hypothetical protein